MGKKRQSDRNLLVGIDIGTSKVVAIVGEVTSEGAVHVVGIGSSPSRGLKRGVVVNIESTVHSIQRAIQEAELMAGCQIHSAYTGIAGSHIRSLNSHGIVAIRDQEVSQSDIDRVIDAARAVAIPADMDDAVSFASLYAPEHLIIATENPVLVSRDVVNAGSVFLGNYSCESAGDYASGTNHTLPTSGNARAYSGVSLDSFVKKITFQHLSQEGITSIGNAVETMAEEEQLFAHKNAMTLRLGAVTATHLQATTEITPENSTEEERDETF